MDIYCCPKNIQFSIVSDWKSISDKVDKICTGEIIDKLVRTEMAKAKSYAKVDAWSSFEDVKVMVDRLFSPDDSKKVTVRSGYAFYSGDGHIESD